MEQFENSMQGFDQFFVESSAYSVTMVASIATITVMGTTIQNWLFVDYDRGTVYAR